MAKLNLCWSAYRVVNAWCQAWQSEYFLKNFSSHWNLNMNSVRSKGALKTFLPQPSIVTSQLWDRYFGIKKGNLIPNLKCLQQIIYFNCASPVYHIFKQQIEKQIVIFSQSLRALFQLVLRYSRGGILHQWTYTILLSKKNRTRNEAFMKYFNTLADPKFAAV